MGPIEEWLSQLGLARYTELFVDNEIDLEAARLLSDGDLAQLGVPLGPRRKILHAIAALTADSEAADHVQPAAASGAPPIDVLAEHRQLTVMFIDLVGWTEIAERLDDDHLPELLRRYHETCAGAIAQHEGYIAQYLGDGLLVYFGYPRAHENDAERAVHAGLDIVEAITAMSDDLLADGLPALAVRVGIHTGLTVVGEIGGRGRHEQLALGSTPNLAARIQGAAHTNTVFIGAPTRRLIARSFRCADLGPVMLKGAQRPMRLFHVLGPRSWGTRFEALRRGRLTPLVGREREIGVLMDSWQLVKENIGQVICVVGEPGIGKSRLLGALRDRLRNDAPMGAVLQCLPRYSNTPLHPVIEHAERVLGIAPEDSDTTKLEKIQALLLQTYGLDEDDVRLMAALMMVPYADRIGALRLVPQRQKAETLRMLVDVTEAACKRDPLLLIVEDAHWADPSTVDMLEQLALRTPSIPLMLLITHRPEFSSSGFVDAGATLLTLPRLSPAQSGTIVARMNRGGLLDDGMVRQIMAHADGIPLFLEEMTKAVLESADATETSAPNPATPIPATLRDSLMSRLDRVPGGKLVAQIGAIIGREFGLNVLNRIAQDFKVDVPHALRGLMDAGLVLPRQVPGDTVYYFKHALVQDVAEDSLLKAARRSLHARTARVLEAHFSGMRDAQPEVLAHHFTEAGELDQAVPYWILAGKRAAASLAHVEALRHFERALELLRQRPPSAGRHATELDLRVALGAVLVTIKGYATAEVESNYARASELCAITPDPRCEGSVLRGQTQLLLLRARYAEADVQAEQLLALGERQGDVAQQVDGNMMLGLIAIYRGAFEAAAQRLRGAIKLLDRQGHRRYGASNGVDLAIGCIAYYARAMWFLGFPDQAKSQAAEATVLAEQPAVWLGAAQGLAMRALLHHAEGDLDGTLTYAERAATHARQHGIPYWEAVCDILIGWVRARRGDAQRGLEQIESGWVNYGNTGAALGTSWVMATLADAQRAAGDHAGAVRSIDYGLRHAEETGELYFAPELWRIKGELALPARTQEAESAYLEAIRLARAIGARSWELRAATNLADLWRESRPQEATAQLQEVFSRFNEGFESIDLQRAAHLLAQLQTSALGQLTRVVHQGKQTVRRS